MISLVFQFALFFLVLFVLVPGLIITFKVLHNLRHNRHSGWHSRALAQGKTG